MNSSEVILEGEPPPPYTSCENEGCEYNNCESLLSTNNQCIDDVASCQYPPRDQNIHSAQNHALQTTQRQQSLQELPPNYQQSQLKYIHQAPLVNPCPDNQAAFVPRDQTGQLPSLTCRGRLDQPHPEYVPREHPNWPLQLRFPFAAVSSQPLQSFATQMQNPNIPDSEQLIDRDDPDDNYFLAWVACLLCCWPIGIPAIIASHKARDASKRGEHQLAYKYSKLSGQLSWCAIIIGCLFYLMVILITLRVLKII